VIDQFFFEYWLFVEALVEHALRLLGVSALNEQPGARARGLPQPMAGS
jgi:hypothetical protein